MVETTEFYSKNEVIINAIDNSIGSNGAHSDIAKVVYEMYKHRFKYSKEEGSKKYEWYYLDDDNSTWKEMYEGYKLRNIINFEICQKYMERSCYWNIESTTSGLSDETRCRYQERNRRLLEIALKMKNTNYKDSIIKECKYLFIKN
jgi:hypothetical protein